MRSIIASGRTEQGDRVSLGDQTRQCIDVLLLSFHLSEVALAILVPGNRRPVFAVKIRVQLPARAQIGQSCIPCLVLLANAARTVAANEDAEYFSEVLRIVPAFGIDRHDGI